MTGFNTSDQGGTVWSVQLGGLVGANYGTVEDTYATGDVTGVGHVAGLAGSVWNNGVVRRSYSVGAVSLKFADWPNVGGLVGWVYGGTVESSSYWNTETSGQDEGASQISVGGVFEQALARPPPAAARRPPAPTPASTRLGHSECLELRKEQRLPLPPLPLRRGGRLPRPRHGPGLAGGPGSPLPPQENRRASVTVAAVSPLTVGEGGTAAYTVVLDGEPTGYVTVTVSSDNADVTAQPSGLTFTPGQLGDAADRDRPRGPGRRRLARRGHQLSHAVSGPDGYAGIAVDSVAVTVTDDDTATVTVRPDRVTLPEGWTGSYTAVAVPPARRATCRSSCSATNPDVVPYPNPVVFTPDNWQTRQLVGVPAAHDDDTVDEEAFILHAILAAAGSGYEGVAVPPIHSRGP